MSHDLYASWATAELAQMFKANPNDCFALNPTSTYDVFANRESGRHWPIPDGRLSIDVVSSRFEMALEMKRTNEGLHGVLTAIGQSQAYINPAKGYTSSVIVIPDEYSSHDSPGPYIESVLNHVNPNLPIGVYSYAAPDTSIASPFRGKLTCHRPVNMLTTQAVTSTNPLASQRSTNQWAHLREGSSEPDAFYRYLQVAKRLGIGTLAEPIISLPQELIDASLRLSPSTDPLKYLSFSSNDIFHDFVWRNFWFDYILTTEVSTMYNLSSGVYTVNDVPTRLRHISGSGMKKFFSGRIDSIKNRLSTELTAGTKTENLAWEEFALNIHNRAHSYREDIDSSLEHLGFLESDGKPSELGYKFVDACERSGDPTTGTPKLIYGAAILKNGSLNALLHYFYKLSEERLRLDPMAFTTNTGGRLVFDKFEYLSWIKNELANNLNVMSTASLRGGSARRAFQAELSILRKFDFVSGFRVGVGLEINWPLIQEFIDYDI
ncbi:MAG: hypothetical protein QNK51_07490 [Chitinophagales bacterium]|jgi:hypothetical protein|tara:strand:+ start:260 stop:1735 length:1476 start_codon:yes stop_codon:yes gene_type:complete